MSTPLAFPLRWAAVRVDPKRKQKVEWRLRIDRDTAAMRALVNATLGPSDAAVDVGANKGEITEWFVQAAPEATHHIVEPLPHLAADLRARFPTVQVHECALSDSTGGSVSFFHVVNRPAWSGLKRQDAVADADTVEIEVALRRLDDVVGDGRVRLIKIDVEGAEMAVLRGATETLRRDRPLLLLEHAPIHADLFDTKPEQVWEFLDAAGYTVAPVAEPDRLLDRATFIDLCEGSHRTGYDRHAVTNWVARPR